MDLTMVQTLTTVTKQYKLLLPSQLSRTSHLPTHPLIFKPHLSLFVFLWYFSPSLFSLSIIPCQYFLLLVPISTVLLNDGSFKAICFALSFEERSRQNAGPSVLGSIVGLCAGMLSLGWAGSLRGPSPWISSILLLSHFARVKSKTECSGLV